MLCLCHGNPGRRPRSSIWLKHNQLPRLTMRVALSVVSLTLLLGACQVGRLVDDSADRIDQTVDRAVDRVDSSLEKSKEKIDQTISGIRQETSELIAELKEVYQTSVAATADEIDDLRRRFRTDLDALDEKIRARVDQVQEAAYKLVQAGDAAVQARIDQVFAELRRFSADSLSSVRELIGPILDMAKSIGKTADASSEAIERISLKIASIIEKFESILTEVKNLALKLQGKDEQGNKTGTDWGAILGTIGTAMAGLLAWIRSREKAKEGDRWKPEELTEHTRSTVSTLLKSGEFDDEVAGLLTRIQQRGAPPEEPPPVNAP